MEFRIGQGVDLHRFAPNRKLILGGTEIPHTHGLDGHSDADALLHALTDALLGALGKGDIGTVYPDTSSEWKDACSVDLMRNVWIDVHKAGWMVVNLDCTIIAQVPKLQPYIPKMKSTIAEVFGISVDRCAIKATTAETLGSIGRSEGVFASAVILLQRG